MVGIVKGLLGKKSSAEGVLQQFSPSGFRSPGLTGFFDKGRNAFSVSRSSATSDTLKDIRAGFEGKAGSFRERAAALLEQRDTLTGLRGETAALRPELAGLRGEVRGLRGEVRPGFGRLTRERVNELRGLRDRSVGNLRDELTKRRIAGSSFAAREIGALESEFGRQEDLVRAESFLQEMDATNQLLQQELGILSEEGDVLGQEASIALQEAGLTDLSFESVARAFDSAIEGAQTELSQLNLETSIAAELSSLSSQLMNQNITAQAEARAAQEVGAFNFFADIIAASILSAGDKKSPDGDD